MGPQYLSVKKTQKTPNGQGNGIVHVTLQLSYATTVPHIFKLNEN